MVDELHDDRTMMAYMYIEWDQDASTDIYLNWA